MLRQFPLFRANLLLLGLDALGLLLIFNAAHYFRMGHTAGWISWPLLALILITLVTLYVMDTYRVDVHITAARTILQSLGAMAIAGVLSAVFVYLIGPDRTQPLYWRGVLPISMLAFAFWATFARYLIFRWAQKRTRGLRWLCIGGDQWAQKLWEEVQNDKNCGELVFVNDPASCASNTYLPHKAEVIKSLGQPDEVIAQGWSGIIAPTSTVLPDNVVSQLMQLRLQGLPVYDVTDFYEKMWSKLPILHLQDGWFVGASGFDMLYHTVSLKVKRVIDLILAVTLLLALLPVAMLIGLIIKIDSPGPILFSQLRVGQTGRPFKLYKFRSMAINAEQDGAKWASHDDPRITRVGRVLRKMRIDEVAQIINVLKGEMSFIGPRPERPEFVEKLEQLVPYYELRHLVKPGITGWAQVMYPYGASVEDAQNKLSYDLYYIKNYSVYLDLFIIMKTLRVIFHGKGR